MHGHIARRIDHARLDVGRGVANQKDGQKRLSSLLGAVGAICAKGGPQTGGAEATFANKVRGLRR